MRSRNEDRRSDASRRSLSEPIEDRVQQIYLDEDGYRTPIDFTASRSELDAESQTQRIGDAPSTTQRIDREPFYTITDDGTIHPDDIAGDSSSGEMSYHEERMARKALAAKEGKSHTSSRNRSAQQRAQQTSKSAQASRQEQISRQEQSARRQPSRQTQSQRQAQSSRQAQARAKKTQAARRSQSSRQTQRDRQQLKKQQTQRLDPVAVRKEAARRRRRRNRLPLIILGAVIIAAIAIVLLIVTRGIKEAANVKITSTETTQTITWEKKEKNASYEVLQKTPEGSYNVVKTIDVEGTPSATIVELNSATEYEYKIRTIKGDGDKTRHSNGVTVHAYTLPSAVTELTYWTEVKNSLTFSWADAQNVSGYELRFGTSDNLNDSTPIRLAVADLEVDDGTGNYTYLIENLEERTTYFFSLRSYINDSTYSSWTDIRSARVSRPVDMRGIDVNAPMVALTFDDGPDNSDITSRILDTFATYGGHATFFQLGTRAESYPDRIQRMVNEGHEVGNHTYDHAHLGDAVTREDIVRANDAIEAACGVRPVSFRSPGGNTTDFIRQICIEENMSLYYWSLDTRDWYTRDADSVISVIKNNVSDGDIILMHNIYGSTADAVNQIVPWLQEQGYQLVTVSQLLKAKTGELPEPGTQYATATKTMN